MEVHSSWQIIRFIGRAGISLASSGYEIDEITPTCQSKMDISCLVLLQIGLLDVSDVPTRVFVHPHYSLLPRHQEHTVST